MKTYINATRQLKRIGFLLLTGLLLTTAAFAQGLKVAAAANLQSIIEVLQKDFKQRTGIEIEPIIGSSGKLVAQIKYGAPFDVFLSADMSFPQALYKEGLSTKPPVVYAYGSLIICSNQDIGFENWERILLTTRVKKIAIANPATAPYGLAAQELLQKKGILDNVKNKIVVGESIAQVNTYITTGVVEVGFTTQALIKDPGNVKLYWKLIDPKAYAPIQQGMVILKHAENNPDAGKFYQYLLSADAKRIFEEYGYRVQ
jgi:molybdate transport system substrate-binding protein